MITKERLEVLIEQGATIYTSKHSYAGCGIKLDKEHFEATDDYLVFTYKVYEIWLDQLFEKQEDAEWYREFGTIERPYRLNLLSYEEMNKKWEEKEIVERYYYYVKHFMSPSEIGVEKTYSMYLLNNGHIVIDNNELVKTVFDAPLTRENYTLACRKARKLFLGEDDEEIQVYSYLHRR